ncbi:MAG TPA: glycosyltransferase family A protein [Thermoanaerobaculia bacterium]|jgi:glycosyltransferase involved in cell wall biosynthesis|nr:glycosyltransferase family A protein [Thermoanaerobaculia bacterium]
MTRSVDLFWVGGTTPPPWPLGRAIGVAATPGALHRAVADELARSAAEAQLFWGSRLGAPNPARIEEALGRPGDVWHAGLRLGMGGLPAAIDFVAPVWMLNCDPDPAVEATSWRLSLEACLARTEVLRSLGGPRPEFETLAGAGLELGHRWITRGALIRSLPSLLAGAEKETERVRLPLEDEMRFVRARFGRFWLRWSLLRAVLTKRAGLREAVALGRRLEREPTFPVPPPLRGASAPDRPSRRRTVTVLVPTVDRYPYLEKLLEQLGRQTVRPLEVIVVDQTSPERRRANLAASFPSLPLRVIELDRAGQCSSRNAGLEASSGDCILFLDDDDEVPSDLIERHLASLDAFRNEVSCGVAEEDGAGPLPEAFRLYRSSDVFPTNNSLIVRDVLSRSGLFDLTYDRGARADADLGMRIYLAGCLMVLNPEIKALHHHAPSGGLRTHGARVITYASSRKRLMHRHLPAITEIYLARRYFSERQADEFLWLQAVATLAFKGAVLRRALKAVIGVALLPDTLRQIRRRDREARALLGAGPRIPRLPGPPAVADDAATRKGAALA